MTPDDVPKDSIRGVTAERVTATRAAGRRLRVVCSAELSGEAVAARRAPPGDGTTAPADAGGRVRATVRLTELAPDHPLFSAGGSTLSVLLHTDLMGTVQVAEHDALPDQTAYAIYSDLLAIHAGR